MGATIMAMLGVDSSLRNEKKAGGIQIKKDIKKFTPKKIVKRRFDEKERSSPVSLSNLESNNNLLYIARTKEGCPIAQIKVRGERNLKNIESGQPLKSILMNACQKRQLTRTLIRESLTNMKRCITRVTP